MKNKSYPPYLTPEQAENGGLKTPMNMTVPLTFTDDKEQLVAGLDYIVLYVDTHTNKKIVAGGVWNGEKFIYCTGRFTNPSSVMPTFDHVKGHHHIIGFCCLPNFGRE